MVWRSIHRTCGRRTSVGPPAYRDLATFEVGQVDDMAALVFHRAKETGRLEVECIGGGVHVGAGGAARGGTLGRVVFDRELLVPATAVEQTDLDLVGIGAAGTLN